MKAKNLVELTSIEKQAIKNCVETIDCEGMPCSKCPFNYNCGCMLQTLREIAEEY